LYYDKSHTWAFMEKDGTVKIGLDDFLQHVIGTTSKIIMKKVGEKVKKGEAIFSLIQKGKLLIIHAPVTGIIKEQNDKLHHNSSLINSSPYSEGWVYAIEPLNWMREIQFLVVAEKYKEWIKGEFTRLKDFLAAVTLSNKMEFAQIALQEGGEIRDGVLAELGPEVWEDFQNNFINTSR